MQLFRYWPNNVEYFCETKQWRFSVKFDTILIKAKEKKQNFEIDLKLDFCSQATLLIIIDPWLLIISAERRKTFGGIFEVRWWPWKWPWILTGHNWLKFSSPTNPEISNRSDVFILVIWISASESTQKYLSRVWKYNPPSYHFYWP